MAQSIGPLLLFRLAGCLISTACAVLALAQDGGVTASDLHSGASTNTTFDFFYFVRQWGPGYCDHKRCKYQPTGNDLSIHGLWPNKYDGSYPHDCDPDASFDEDLVADLLPDLRREWPSYMSLGDSFWAHEWLKHGTCSRPVLNDEHEYFRKILRLNEQYPFMPSLEAAGVRPSWTASYELGTVVRALERAVGVPRSVQVHCSGVDLTEVWLLVALEKSIQKKQVSTGAADAPPYDGLAAEVSEGALAHVRQAQGLQRGSGARRPGRSIDGLLEELLIMRMGAAGARGAVRLKMQDKTLMLDNPLTTSARSSAAAAAKGRRRSQQRPASSRMLRQLGLEKLPETECRYELTEAGSAHVLWL
ncbi:hypothetical protein WJX81_005770 [Elliptochloris bilobata]|uniref:Uncharacterized protein n=1 Tax=Elliptochloris bilobata TaxID=381761 RepID=A0AAW1S4N5_9CHLO